MEIATGTYTGNGTDNHAITGVGFQPDFLYVKGDTTQLGLAATSAMAAGRSTPLYTTAELVDAGIKSLDADGFTLGTDARGNSSGVTYYYVAIKDDGNGDFKVGSYVGDGVQGRDISGVGFQPDGVIVIPWYAARNATFYSDVAVTNKASRFNGYYLLTADILGVHADGFTVGNGSRVNYSGKTNYYVCYKDESDSIKVGFYTGDGNDDRSISGVGFQPLWMFAKNTDAGDVAVHCSDEMLAGNSFFFTATAKTVDLIQALETDGFQVGTNNAVNELDKKIVYHAFANRPAPPTPTPPAAEVNPDALTGYHCFREQFQKRRVAGLIPYKQPDGALYRDAPSG